MIDSMLAVTFGVDNIKVLKYNMICVNYIRKGGR